MGLNPEDYAPGHIVRWDGNPVVIHDQVVSANGGRFLIVSQPDSDFFGLMAEGTLRDDQDDRAETVSDDDAHKIREDAISQQGNDPAPKESAPVTGDTEGTAPPAPAPDATTTPAPGEQGGTTPSE